MSVLGGRADIKDGATDPDAHPDGLTEPQQVSTAPPAAPPVSGRTGVDTTDEAAEENDDLAPYESRPDIAEPLTAMQWRFVQHWFTYINATLAARHAGYSARSFGQPIVGMNLVERRRWALVADKRTRALLAAIAEPPREHLLKVRYVDRDRRAGPAVFASVQGRAGRRGCVAADRLVLRSCLAAAYPTTEVWSAPSPVVPEDQIMWPLNGARSATRHPPRSRA